jgi:hypothetical protein
MFVTMSLIAVLTIVLLLGESHDSSIGIATVWTAWDPFSAEAKDFALLHGVQTGSGAHPASYPMGTGGSILVGKAAGA